MKKKTIIICVTVAIAVFAASLGITYAIITANRTPAATPDEAAADAPTAVSTEATKQPTTAAPTEATTEPPTEPPTEPSEAAAFRAYLEILETNESAIKNYNWQLSGGETKPIAFKDIMGDSTPEMIYLYAEKVYDTHNGKNSGTAGMRVYTYLDGEAKSAYENKSWSQNYVQTDEPYMLFQIQDDNALYAYCDTSKTYAGFEILRFTDNGGTLLEEKVVEYFDGMPQSSGKIEGNDVSAAEAKQKGKALLQSAPNALMISTIGKFVYDTNADRLAFLGIDSTGKENQAKTYDEAVDYLKNEFKLSPDDINSTNQPATNKSEPEIEYSPLSEFEYKDNDNGGDPELSPTGGIVITKYIGSDSIVRIPQTIDGKPVDEIGACAFQDCNTISDVIIPDTVKTIGYEAFFKSSIQTIIIPDTVKTMGRFAFYKCEKLEKVTLGTGLTVIPASAFNDCTALKSIEIPDGIVEIGGYAFYNCASLSNVKIPYSVKSIDDWAFYSTPSLSTITIPPSVKKIGDAAVGYGYSGLQSIHGQKGSAAAEYAKAHNFTFIADIYIYVEESSNGLYYTM